MGKHVMLSYQWNTKSIVEKVYDALQKLGFPVWMDVKGGMHDNVNDSMAFAVDNAAVVCCFISPEYQESKNCKKELNYADSQDAEIIPCMTKRGWKAKEWLGLLTAGLLWIDFREDSNMDTRVESLAKEIVHKVGQSLTMGSQESSAPSVDLVQRPGRAFCHAQCGKYLAESGEVKFHAASGNRSSLVLRDSPEDTSYWVEEKGEKGTGIVFYKNYSTDGYLGYDPNGDYVYTKGQHYGAEEWKLIADDESSNGKRAVVIYANYGQKFLAIRNGKLTGVSERSDDCIWYLT